MEEDDDDDDDVYEVVTYSLFLRGMPITSIETHMINSIPKA